MESCTGDTEQEGHRTGVWRHPGLAPERGDKEEDGGFSVEVVGALDKPPQPRVRHKVWREQLVDNTGQLKLGDDRARQMSDMEMLDGTEVVRAVDAPGAVPGAVGVVGTGEHAKTGADAGGGLVQWPWPVPQVLGGGDGDGDWDEWDMGDWVAGTGVDTERAGTGALPGVGSEGVGVEVGA